MAYKKPKVLELPAPAKPKKTGKQKKKKEYDSVFDSSFDRALDDLKEQHSERNAATVRTSLVNLKAKNLGTGINIPNNCDRNLTRNAPLR